MLPNLQPTSTPATTIPKNTLMFCVWSFCFVCCVFASTAQADCTNALSIKRGALPLQSYDGQPILSVRIATDNVFDLSDPKENKALYRVLNKLHPRTDPNVIRSQLLFKKGDKLNASELDETERLLRAKPYLTGANITVDEVCENGVAVLVRTRDVWTTEPQFTLSREGDANKTGLSLTEKNFSGTGNEVSVGYLHTADRTENHYQFFSPHLFNSRLTAKLSHSDNSDGENNLVEVKLPFYSLKSDWTYGFQFEDKTQRENIRYRDETINRYRHRQEVLDIYLGRKIYATEEVAHRALIGFTHDRHAFDLAEDPSRLPGNYNHDYPWLEYRFLENKFAEYTNLHYMHRVEDVLMGKQLRARVGYGRDAVQQGEDTWRWHLNYSDLLSVDEQHLLGASFQYHGQHIVGLKDVNESVYGGYLEYFYLFDNNDRWYARLQYNRGQDLRQHNELTLGGEKGLRGYPLDFQRGEERTVFTLERRRVTNLHILNLFRVGVLGFYEIGRVTGGGYEHAPYLSNVGVGLRIASSKARIGNVIHIDLAHPLTKNDDIKSVQLVIKASSRF